MVLRATIGPVANKKRGRVCHRPNRREKFTKNGHDAKKFPLKLRYMQPKHNVGELVNVTTKIITLLEFFNFVSKVSRLQYE
jgi:hypothetical protein